MAEPKSRVQRQIFAFGLYRHFMASSCDDLYPARQAIQLRQPRIVRGQHWGRYELRANEQSLSPKPPEIERDSSFARSNRGQSPRAARSRSRRACVGPEVTLGPEVTMYINIVLTKLYDEMADSCPRTWVADRAAVERLCPHGPAAASGTPHHPPLSPHPGSTAPGTLGPSTFPGTGE